MEILYKKINSRCNDMMSRGVADEVREFLNEQSNHFQFIA